MDNQKDKNLQIGETERSKNLFIVKLFEKDNFFLFVYKKTERIVSALYLTSNLFSDSEPIKWQVRKVGVEVISRVLSLTTSPLSKSEIVLNINSSLLKLLSLIDISFHAGFISEMNFTILKNELEALLGSITFESTSKNKDKTRVPSLNKDFFSLPRGLFFSDVQVGETSSDPMSGAKTVPSVPLYAWEDIRNLNDTEETYKGHQKDKHITPEISFKNKTAAISGKGQNVKNDEVSTDRQLSIIKLLKENSNLMIKDFSSTIKGCSEKTVQRELLRLVRIGVLKKSGERRWSRYSLANS